MALKSASELAMEKAGAGRSKPLTDEQKLAVQKLRAEFAARKKELKFIHEAEVAGAMARIEREDDQEGLAKMKADFADRLAGLEAEEEAAVEKIKS